jgi:hypothetical protein
VRRIARVDGEGVLVNVVSVNMVQMAIMQIIDVPVVAERCMSAVGTMSMSMIGMMFFSAGVHVLGSFPTFDQNSETFGSACPQRINILPL